MCSLIDEASATVTYIGYSQMKGAPEGNAVWKIKKISQSGTVWKIQFADGDYQYDNIWTNRASLTYK